MRIDAAHQVTHRNRVEMPARYFLRLHHNSADAKMGCLNCGNYRQQQRGDDFERRDFMLDRRRGLRTRLVGLCEEGIARAQETVLDALCRLVQECLQIAALQIAPKFAERLVQYCVFVVQV